MAGAEARLWVPHYSTGGIAQQLRLGRSEVLARHADAGPQRKRFAGQNILRIMLQSLNMCVILHIEW